VQSSGIIETYSAASIIVASDAAVKVAAGRLLDIRLAMGLGEKDHSLIAGRVVDINAVLEAGTSFAGAV
jgi:microcompartment protein CcmL/EutN